MDIAHNPISFNKKLFFTSSFCFVSSKTVLLILLHSFSCLVQKFCQDALFVQLQMYILNTFYKLDEKPPALSSDNHMYYPIICITWGFAV